MSVVVEINDALTKDKYTFLHAVQPDIELRLRQAGIKVVEPSLADAALLVEVYGFWSSDVNACSWTTMTRVMQYTHVIRRGQHYQMFSCIWSNDKISHAGGSHFTGFTQVITEQITSFLNDYLAANQP